MDLAKIGLILCLFVSMAIDAGTRSYRQGGASIYFTELGHLKHQADLGDPSAQFQLGNLYLSPPEDTAIKQDLERAAEYYFQAALRNHAAAQFNLGVLYYRGSGVVENKMMSSVWFALAAENSSISAKSVSRSAKSSLDDLQQELAEDEKNQQVSWVAQYREVIASKNYRMMKLPNL